jgi:hypothetical protein
LRIGHDGASVGGHSSGQASTRRLPQDPSGCRPTAVPVLNGLSSVEPDRHEFPTARKQDWCRDGRLPSLPELLAAIKAEQRIWIPEGERDVHTLIECCGVAATCNPMGAGKWRDEYAQYFKGADVVVTADSDEPGLKHAREVVKSLQGIAAKVELVGIPSGRKDVTEHVAAGGKLSELETLAREPERPPVDTAELLGTSEGSYAGSWFCLAALVVSQSRCLSCTPGRSRPHTPRRISSSSHRRSNPARHDSSRCWS